MEIEALTSDCATTRSTPVSVLGPIDPTWVSLTSVQVLCFDRIQRNCRKTESHEETASWQSARETLDGGLTWFNAFKKKCQISEDLWTSRHAFFVPHQIDHGVIGLMDPQVLWSDNIINFGDATYINPSARDGLRDHAHDIGHVASSWADFCETIYREAIRETYHCQGTVFKIKSIQQQGLGFDEWISNNW